MSSPPRNFVTCHSHPQSLDSASTPEAFAEREVELGTGYITCTDHGTLVAARKVYDIAHGGVGKDKVKLTPIVGLEGYFRDDDCPIFKGAGIPKNEEGSYVDYFKYAHVTIHCLDYDAYKVLVRKLSAAALRAEQHGSELKPLFSWQDMEEIGAANTTITSGCLIGMVQRHLLDNNDPAMAVAYYERLRSLARPGNFHVEIFPHRCTHNWEQGVFVTIADGQVRKFHGKKGGKWLRTDRGEIRSMRLVEDWKKDDHGGHIKLLGVKHYHKWDDFPESAITNVEYREGFLQNECRPWALDGDVQLGCNRFVARLAKKYGDTILIGDDSHFARLHEKIAQDVRLQGNSGGAWKMHASYHRQSSAEAFAYFGPRMGMSERDFERIVEDTHAWAERFKGFKFESQPSLPTSFYPKDTLAHTMSLIRKVGRMDWNDQKYKERLARELKLLHANGVIDLLSYFFIDEEVVSLYEREGELTGPGRGSAAGLLLAYLLGITHVDPLEFDLSVERFLTEDRIKSGKMPDIDQDLPHRELLVGKDDQGGWLQQRFGKCVAQISVDTTLKLKSAVLDVARETYDKHVPPEVARLAHRFMKPPQGISDHDFVFGYKDADNWEDGSITYDPALQEYVQKYPKDWEIVQLLLGLARQKGRHACAFLLGNQEVEHYIPTMLISGVRCTQFTAPQVEACGGLKMDFLVINSLRDIALAIRLIQQRSSMEVPAEARIGGKRVPRVRIIPHDGQLLDVWKLWTSPHAAEAFQDVSEGKTETVFQFNTPGAVKWLKHFNYFKPNGKKVIDSIEAMSAFTALDRPGPLNSKFQTPDGKHVNMLEEYARRARGLDPAQSLEVFTKLLPETYGLCVYQEQLQRMYQHLTGCTGAEAEEFRSNVAKKKMEKVLKSYDFFMNGATKTIGKEDAEQIWKMFKEFGQYAFNKSHSVCYSVIGYACAYLKRWFPLEWWTAVLRNADKNEVNETFWPHCGHLIDLPDVQRSSPDGFTIQANPETGEERIRAPIDLLQGVGPNAHAQLMAGRPYADIRDFCRKIHLFKKEHAQTVEREKPTGEKYQALKLGTSALNSKVVHTLIVSGVMDPLFPKSRTVQIGDRTVEVELTVLDQLQMYEQALAETKDEVFPKPPTKRGAPRKPTQPKKLDEKMYGNLHQIVRYQMRKAVLPAYSVPLLPMLVERRVEGVQVVDDMPFYSWRNDRLRILSARGLDHLNNLSPFPDKHTVQAAVAAYVIGVRPFEYAEGQKEACELVLDVEGHRFKQVKWADRTTGRPPAMYRPELKGSVVICILSKFAEGRSCAIDETIVVQPPLDFKGPAEATADPEEE